MKANSRRKTAESHPDRSQSTIAKKRSFLQPVAAMAASQAWAFSRSIGIPIKALWRSAAVIAIILALFFSIHVASWSLGRFPAPQRLAAFDSAPFSFNTIIAAFKSNRRITYDAAVFSVAAIVAALFVLPRLANRTITIKRPFEIAAALIVALALSFMAAFNGFQQFCGWDQGGLCELAYRLSLGQVPYVDFTFNMPYVFFIGLKLAVAMFGQWFGAFIVFGAVLAFLSFLWSYAMVRALGCKPDQSIVYCTVIQAMVYLGRGYFWYNPATSEATILLFLATMVVIRHQNRPLAWGSFTFAVLLVMIGKPNCYAMLPACLLAVALCGLRPAVYALGCYGLAFGGLLLIGYVAHVPAIPTIMATLGAAKGRAKSLFSSPFFTDADPAEIYLVYLQSIACVVVGGIVGLQYFKSLWPDASERRALLGETLCMLACAFTGLLFVQTNGEGKFSDLVVLLAPVGLLVLLQERTFVASSDVRRPLAHIIPAVVLALLSLSFLDGAVAWGYVRRVVETGGPGLFFEHEATVRADSPAYFRGIAMGDYLDNILSDFGNVQKQIAEIAPKSKLLIGPRLAFLYPAFHVPPPTKLPMVWMPGDGFPVERKDEFLANFRDHNFDFIVILFRTATDGRETIDTTYMPQELLDIIFKSYRPVGRTKTLLVMHRR